LLRNRKWGRLFALSLVLLLATAALVGCAADDKADVTPTEKTITDMGGRTVTVPSKIERVLSSGPPGGIILYTLCPDKMVGWNTELREGEKRFIKEKYQKLPVVGGWYARMVRSYVLMEKGKGYISLAVTGGSSTARILFRHILPNILPGLLVLFALGIGDVIMTISAFSFLGVALPSGTPEWGVMLNEARGVFLKSPRYAIYPGLCVFFTVCAFNLLGEGLRRRLSPFGKAADKALLSVRNLSITYRCDDTSISGVTFSIAKGKVLGLAGESGSGKSSVCKAILGLINPGLATVCGEIEFMGRDILPLSYEERRKINGKEIASTGPPCSLFPMICGYSRF
jgi:hypothetical protein